MRETQLNCQINLKSSIMSMNIEDIKQIFVREGEWRSPIRITTSHYDPSSF